MPGRPVVSCSFAPGAPEVEPPDLASLLSMDPASPSDGPVCLLPAPVDEFDLLDAPTAQCQAAAASTVAAAIELERHYARLLISCDSDKVDDAFCLNRDLLALRAADARNKAAGEALEAFYNLAGLEARSLYLDMAVAESRTTLSRIERLAERGLPTPDAIQADEVRVRIADLQDTRLVLEQTRIQLNGRLKKLLGCPLDETRMFRPEVDWAPDFATVSAEEAVQTGLASRTDVRSLSVVYCNLQQHTLPVARAVLAFADSSLGRVEPVHKLLCYGCAQEELPIRCRQLRMLIGEARVLASAEIKGAVYDIAAAQQRVRLAAAAAEDQRRGLLRLEKRRDLDNTTVFERSAARARVFQAESDLIDRVVELNIAHVRFKRAQHLLGVECGYAAVTCLEGRCCRCNCN
ncbi:TolC family protein [Pirellulimonas nuda]|nr:hypothetical protein [Pirellulimonas nuda]